MSNILNKIKYKFYLWQSTSPSTRNPSLIRHHIKELGFINYLRGHYYDDKYYDYSFEIESAYAELAKVLKKYILGNTLGDIGCGSGMLLYKIDKIMELDDFLALDFKEKNNHIKFRSVRNKYNYFNLLDICEIDKKVETGMCIEVLEHIKRNKIERALINIDNLITDRLILSVAKPGQWGDGHITCMPKKWWLKKFTFTNFSYDIELSNKLNKDIKTNSKITQDMEWILDNFMIFNKD